LTAEDGRWRMGDGRRGVRRQKIEDECETWMGKIWTSESGI
jgi:hypothetical protein